MRQRYPVRLASESEAEVGEAPREGGKYWLAGETGSPD